MASDEWCVPREESASVQILSRSRGHCQPFLCCGSDLNAQHARWDSANVELSPRVWCYDTGHETFELGSWFGRKEFAYDPLPHRYSAI